MAALRSPLVRFSSTVGSHFFNAASQLSRSGNFVVYPTEGLWTGFFASSSSVERGLQFASHPSASSESHPNASSIRMGFGFNRCCRTLLQRPAAESGMRQKQKTGLRFCGGLLQTMKVIFRRFNGDDSRSLTLLSIVAERAHFDFISAPKRCCFFFPASHWRHECAKSQSASVQRSSHQSAPFSCGAL